MLADALEEVGIPRGDYIVRVNNRKVLNGVMEVAGVLDPADPDKFAAERGIVLRAIDKIDRLGEAGVRALLGEGRKDESGDFTKGAGLAPEQAEVVMGFMAAKRDTGAATAARLRELVGISALGTEGVDELEQIAALLAAQGYGPDRIVIDPSVVRGLGYYTGPVFEAELTFTILDEKGRPRQLARSRAVAAMTIWSSASPASPSPPPASPSASTACWPRCAPRAGPARPRKARRRHRHGSRPDGRVHGHGRRAAPRGHPGRGLSRQPEEFRQPAQICRQARRAGRRHPGSSEAEKGTVILKDLILGAKIAEGASLEEWKARPAQVEVPRDRLVEALREMLGG